jgi:dihydrolipoamide dehydrogenase
MSDSYDVVVIGAGPGGYVAAIRAAQLGQKVACVERAELGGICLNWGCIPTKALLHSAHLRQEILHAEVHGFAVGPVEVAWDKLIKRSRGVAARLSRGVGSLFKKYGVTHVVGSARIERPGVVVVAAPGKDDVTLAAKQIVVATGARPRPFPGLAFDGETVWSSREAMVSTAKPESLLILGAGAIGCEFAYFYNAFGAKVTLVEMAPRVLPIEDDECSAALEKSFAKQGIDVRTGTRATSVKVVDGKVVAELVGKDGATTTLTADKVLVAIGVLGNVEGLGLEAAGVEFDAKRGQVQVDKDGHTTCPGIWAIGDVAAPPALAHKASAEGIHVAELIAGHPHRAVDLDNIPSCTYCEPQVASVGLPERVLKERQIPYKVGKFPYVGNGKALALEDKEGFAKVLFHAETGALLGAHLFGSAATELIAESVLVRSAELTEADILASVHAHPTLSEAFHEAVGQAFGESVNL